MRECERLRGQELARARRVLAVARMVGTARYGHCFLKQLSLSLSLFLSFSHSRTLALSLSRRRTPRSTQLKLKFRRAGAKLLAAKLKLRELQEVSAAGLRPVAMSDEE